MDGWMGQIMNGRLVFSCTTAPPVLLLYLCVEFESARATTSERARETNRTTDPPTNNNLACAERAPSDERTTCCVCRETSHPRFCVSAVCLFVARLPLLKSTLCACSLAVSAPPAPARRLLFLLWCLVVVWWCDCFRFSKLLYFLGLSAALLYQPQPPNSLQWLLGTWWMRAAWG